MFIDRKINGALIQDLALREGGEWDASVKTGGRPTRGRDGEWAAGEGKDQAEGVKTTRDKKQVQKTAGICVPADDKTWWQLLGDNYMCEQPVVA